ncbi:Hypothetical predicted protein [Paramuricea clavata]|uniref:Uncharacterized protein n=1 Tax=Paramuricea clavata TaxID=317549 RepID=A0A7D9DQK4_PARCT|nr:Hypothetical predicted protein [Paramuricea clavata]
MTQITREILVDVLDTKLEEKLKPIYVQGALIEEVKENHTRLNFTPNDRDNFKVLCVTPNINGTVRKRYAAVHVSLLQASEDEPIFFNDFSPEDRRRSNTLQGHIIHPYWWSRTTFSLLVEDLKTESDLLNEAHNIMKGMEKTLPVYHSRAMKQEFVKSFGMATGGKSAFLRAAYRRLTGDTSAASTTKEADIDQRVSRILDEEDPELIWDLRTNNDGRPEEYKEFLQHCQLYINASVETAVDDRRHVVVGSDDVVTHLATTARQLRSNHVDAHYASALFRYQKEFSIEFRDLTFTSLDDKHTMKVGEPQCPVAPVESGKQVLVSKDKKLAVADHDFTRLTLTPGGDRTTTAMHHE